MTNEEFKRFLSQVETYYPSFREWLQKHDWKAMIQTFYEGMKSDSVTIEEAFEVLDGWNTGRIEGAPVGFENQRFLANLLNAVRDKRNGDRYKRAQTILQKTILGDCEELPIRCKVPNNGPYVGRMVAEFERLRALQLSKGVATV
jgi:hypothetical protein